MHQFDLNVDEGWGLLLRPPAGTTNWPLTAQSTSPATNVACGPHGPTASETSLTERWMPNKVCEVGHVGTQVTATGDPGNRNWLQQRRLARISGVVAWTGIGAWNVIGDGVASGGKIELRTRTSKGTRGYASKYMWIK
jgi:hypothetical protein